jgi:hypothetical protein
LKFDVCHDVNPTWNADTTTVTIPVIPTADDQFQ